MDPMQKLKAKHKKQAAVSKKKAATKKTPKEEKPRKTMSAGLKALTKGKAVGVLLNPKEEAILLYLLDLGGPQGDTNDMVGHIKDFMPFMGTQDKYNCPGNVNHNEAKAYRWAQNSTRKLVRIGLVRRVAKGVIQLHKPNKARRCIRETREWRKEQEKTWTATELHTQLIKFGDYPTKAAVARKAGIDPRRWSRLLNGATPTDEEQEKMNNVGQEI